MYAYQQAPKNAPIPLISRIGPDTVTAFKQSTELTLYDIILKLRNVAEKKFIVEINRKKTKFLSLWVIVNPFQTNA